MLINAILIVSELFSDDVISISLEFIQIIGNRLYFVLEEKGITIYEIILQTSTIC